MTYYGIKNYTVHLYAPDRPAVLGSALWRISCVQLELWVNDQVGLVGARVLFFCSL